MRASHSFTIQSSVHGLPDLARSRTKGDKAFWIVSIGTAFILMGYYTLHVFLEYRMEQVAADIVPRSIERYPDIVYCPFTWLHPEISQKYHLSKDMYIYLESLFIYGRLHKYFVAAPDHVLDSWGNWSSEFDGLLHRHNVTLGTFLATVSYDYNDTFPNYMHEAHAIRKIVNQFGLCYHIDLLQHATLAMFMADAPLTIQYFEPSGTYLSDDVIDVVHSLDRLLIGEQAVGLSPMEGHFLDKTSFKYQIQLKAALIERVSTRRRPCGKWGVSQQLNEHGKCINQHCNDTKQCVYLQPDDLDIRLTTNLCSQMANICGIPERLQKQCWSRAYVPCTLWTYESSISSFESKLLTESNRIHIYFSFSNPQNVIQIKEHKIYSFESLISNIGGQLSLWCGASILSIIQVFYFLLSKFGASKKHKGKLWNSNIDIEMQHDEML